MILSTKIDAIQLFTIKAISNYDKEKGIVNYNNVGIVDSLEYAQKLKSEGGDIQIGDSKYPLLDYNDKSLPFLEQPIEEQVKFSDTELTDEGLSMKVRGNAISKFASAFVEWFKENKGDNYIVVGLKDPKTFEEYEITMQRLSGKSAAQAISEFKAEIEKLKGEVSYLQEENSNLKDDNLALEQPLCDCGEPLSTGTCSICDRDK